MRGGYQSLIWIHDKQGREFVCSTETTQADSKKFEELTKDQQNNCTDVSQMVGTERW